jgi:hypothetical protein
MGQSHWAKDKVLVFLQLSFGLLVVLHPQASTVPAKDKVAPTRHVRWPAEH